MPRGTYRFLLRLLLPAPCQGVYAQEVVGKGVAMPTRARNGNQDSRGKSHLVFRAKNVRPQNAIANPSLHMTDSRRGSYTPKHRSTNYINALLWFCYTVRAPQQEHLIEKSRLSFL